MDHIFEKWDIETSSSQICDNEHANPLFAELEELIFTGALVHWTVDVVWLEAALQTKLVDVLNVILGRTEDDCLLI